MNRSLSMQTAEAATPAPTYGDAGELEQPLHRAVLAERGRAGSAARRRRRRASPALRRRRAPAASRRGPSPVPPAPAAAVPRRRAPNGRRGRSRRRSRRSARDRARRGLSGPTRGRSRARSSGRPRAARPAHGGRSRLQRRWCRAGGGRRRRRRRRRRLLRRLRRRGRYIAADRDRHRCCLPEPASPAPDPARSRCRRGSGSSVSCSLDCDPELRLSQNRCARPRRRGSRPKALSRCFGPFESGECLRPRPSPTNVKGAGSCAITSPADWSIRCRGRKTANPCSLKDRRRRFVRLARRRSGHPPASAPTTR